VHIPNHLPRIAAGTPAFHAAAIAVIAMDVAPVGGAAANHRAASSVAHLQNTAYLNVFQYMLRMIFFD
jgi:hypothetical protein